MTRFEIVDKTFTMFLYSPSNHVGHDGDDHARKNNDAGNIDKAGDKHCWSTNILTVAQITECITVYEQVKWENPLADMLIQTI